MTDLNRYGGACRCLLRLREDEGNPVMEEQAFLAEWRERFPHWEERPGETDVAMMFTLAKGLSLATGMEVFRDYDQVLQEHRAGHSVLVYTERAPEQVAAGQAWQRYCLLLVAMSEEVFSVWCPYPSGQAEVLPRANREWWDKWLAVGAVLYRPPAPSNLAVGATLSAVNAVRDSA